MSRCQRSFSDNFVTICAYCIFCHVSSFFVFLNIVFSPVMANHNKVPSVQKHYFVLFDLFLYLAFFS